MGNNDSRVIVGYKKIIMFFTILACINAVVLLAAIVGIATSYTLSNVHDSSRIAYLYATAISLLGLSVLAFSGTAILFVVKANKNERNKIIELEDLSNIFLNYAPGTMSVWGEDLNALAVSEQALKMFGIESKEQYIDQLFTKLSPELQPCGTPSVEKAKMYIQQAFEKGWVGFEWTHQTLAGEVFPAECTLIRIKRKNDTIVLGFVTDLRPIIASREEELEKLTYQKLQVILDAAPLGCLIADENIKILGCNSTLLQLHGLKDVQEYRENAFKLSPEYQPCGELSSVKREKLIQQAHDEGYVQYEWLYQALDGTPIPVEATLVHAVIDKKHISVCYVRDMRPVYEQREQERDANEHYNLMINTIPLLVNYWGKDHSLKGHNDYAKAYYAPLITGISDIDEAFKVVRKNVIEGTDWFERLDEIFKNGSASFEYEDNTNNVWEVEGVRTIYKGEPVAVTYGKNITKLKELETEQRRRAIAEESDKAKTMFIANISHEIRTPMNSILGYSELALEDTLTERSREYLSMIVASSKLLLSIVNDVLDISKMEAGMLDFEAIPFTAEEIIDQCRDLLQQRVDEKGLTLNCSVIRRSFSTSLKGKCFLGDTIKILQVCINILSNAIKFTKSGGIISASIEIKEIEGDECTLGFECIDTGIGMTEEQMSRVFEPFVQADSSTKREYGGTGLGLAIAKRLIEAMGSNLHVQSAVGVGSKFSFDLKLPLVDIQRDSKGKLADQSTAIKKPVFSGNVLVVDDNEINLGVACEHLKRVGLTPATARDGKEAVANVKARIDNNMPPYDLILMDLHMPEMDGKEASIIISEFNTGTPIIAMTAETITITDDMLYDKFKMHGYLSKPFTSQQLWQCLLAHLKLANSTTSPTTQEETNMYIEDKELLQKLISLFAESNKDTVKNLGVYLEQGDIKSAHMLAHSLKSSARIVGKEALGNIAEEVEHQLRTGLPDSALVSRLTAELQQVLYEFNAR